MDEDDFIVVHAVDGQVIFPEEWAVIEREISSQL